MKYVSSKEFSEMLKQHKQETKVAHKKKLYNKITKEVKNLSMENNDRRKILNSYQRFLKKQSGGDYTNNETQISLNIQNIDKYIIDIKNFIIFLNDNNKSTLDVQDEPKNSNVYYKKIKDSFKNRNDFFKFIQAAKIKKWIIKGNI